MTKKYLPSALFEPLRQELIEYTLWLSKQGWKTPKQIKQLIDDSIKASTPFLNTRQAALMNKVLIAVFKVKP